VSIACVDSMRKSLHAGRHRPGISDIIDLA
jgi:hypothetical protein